MSLSWQTRSRITELFPLLYTSYTLCGLAACKHFGFLRGRGPQSSIFLAAIRLYFFSLAWLPVSQISWSCAVAMLCYLPFYCDLSEYYGHRISRRFRSSFIGEIFKSYFNCKLHPTKSIDSQCIVGIHPHGIIPFGTIANIASETSNFSRHFPALSESRIVIAASSCFLVPGFRDILVAAGVLDCSRFNAERWLAKGWSVFVVPGGAREGLYCNPDVDWLDLKRKLGFLRLAIRYGVPVVPCYSFNEVDYFTQVPFDVVAKIPFLPYLRNSFQKTFGISLPLVYSTTRLRSKGVTTVMGEPIHLPHIENPTDKDVEKCMDIYVAALEKLYNTYAPIYNAKPRSLVIT